MQSLCQWFALCANDATTTLWHPILGDVPICQRCLDMQDDNYGGNTTITSS